MPGKLVVSSLCARRSFEKVFLREDGFSGGGPQALGTDESSIYAPGGFVPMRPGIISVARGRTFNVARLNGKKETRDACETLGEFEVLFYIW